MEVRARAQNALGLARRSLIGAAYECGVPIYTSSPGDSSIGMNVAAMSLVSNQLSFDVSRDVNETAAIVYDAKARGGRSAVLILGGGSPKNFILRPSRDQEGWASRRLGMISSDQGPDGGQTRGLSVRHRARR